GVLRKVMDGGLFPNGIAVSPDNTVLAIGDCAAGRMWYAAFTTGPTMGCPQCTKDPLHLTFQGVKAGTYVPGNGCPDGIHYDVKGGGTHPCIFLCDGGESPPGDPAPPCSVRERDATYQQGVA